jgi:ferredoxin
MIVADRKKIPELCEMIKDHQKVLLLGCGTCVTVCLAGGEREVGIIASALRMSLRLHNQKQIEIDECTIERQCEDAFIDTVAQKISEYDAICSLGCGAGIQALAERFPDTPVYPGINTQFIGILEDQGIWTEKCVGCGECRLGSFMGICPLTRCSKRLLNGPCGGSQEGKCELSEEIECGWALIYQRAKALGKIKELEELAMPQDWSTSNDGGPRKVVREDQRIPSATSKT